MSEARRGGGEVKRSGVWELPGKSAKRGRSEPNSLLSVKKLYQICFSYWKRLGKCPVR